MPAMHGQKTISNSGHSEFRLHGRTYTLTPAQKAEQLQVSESWLAADRLKERPSVDFARFGRLVRYSEET